MVFSGNRLAPPRWAMTRGNVRSATVALAPVPLTRDRLPPAGLQGDAIDPGSSRHSRFVVRFDAETEGERRLDLDVPDQEGTFVEPLAPQPPGDLVVALAGVARPAGRGDVVERVAAAAGECLDTV